MKQEVLAHHYQILAMIPKMCQSHVGLTQCSDTMWINKDGNMLSLTKIMSMIVYPTMWYTQAGNIGKHKPDMPRLTKIMG